MSFSEFYQRSINEPEQFWAEQARRIDWQTPFTQTLDHSNPPFARWFCEGRTNLCHNAIDRWLEKQPEALALIAVFAGAAVILVAAGATGAVRFAIMHYLGYLVKAGHIAVIAEACKRGKLPKNMVEVLFLQAAISLLVLKAVKEQTPTIQMSIRH